MGDLPAHPGSIRSNSLEPRIFCRRGQPPRSAEFTGCQCPTLEAAAHELRRAHQFWSDEIGLNEAVKLFADRIVGHLQIADAYLLGLVLHKNGRLATLDKTLGALLPQGLVDKARLEVI